MDPAAQVLIAAIVCGSVLLMVQLIADAFARGKRSQSLGDAAEVASAGEARHAALSVGRTRPDTRPLAPA